MATSDASVAGRSTIVPGRRIGSRRALPALFVLAALLLGLAEPLAAEAANLPIGFQDESVAASLGIVTALAWEQDDLLVTTKRGVLFRLVNAAGTPQTALDISNRVCTQSERGLLGVAVDPQFSNSANRFVYLYYTVKKQGNRCFNRVSKFPVVTDGSLDAGGETVLLDNIAASGPNHNGGNLEFGADGFIYVSVGDAGVGANAQRRSNLNGKILRITRDGGIPSDNPFNGGRAVRCAKTGGVKDKRKRCQEIFAVGLRNPFRFAFDPNDPNAFNINDVGAGTWEEIDEGRKGANYGWPQREGPCPQGRGGNHCPANPQQFVPPTAWYNHNTHCETITGGAFVPNGSDWGADYVGKYLFADFICDKIFVLTGSGAQNLGSPFASNAGPVTDLLFSPDGTTLYYGAANGQVRKISRSG